MKTKLNKYQTLFINKKLKIVVSKYTNRSDTKTTNAFDVGYVHNDGVLYLTSKKAVKQLINTLKEAIK